MRNPKFWAETALRDYIYPDNITSLDKIQDKYNITDRQKEELRKIAEEYVKKIELSLTDEL